VKNIKTIVVIFLLAIICQACTTARQVDLMCCEEQHKQIIVDLCDSHSYLVRPWNSTYNFFTYSEFNEQNNSVILVTSVGKEDIEIDLSEDEHYSLELNTPHDEKCRVCVMDITLIKIGPDGDYIILDWAISQKKLSD
jgi:hypothetical protein